MTEDWQKQLSEAVTDPKLLCEILNLSEEMINTESLQDFSLRVPRSFIERMEKANPQDPLLLQILPQIAELQQAVGFIKDPVAESGANKIPGLLHKYPGRVLLTIAGSCAINCRYCFRRYFPYADNMPKQAEWQKVLAYIKNDSSIDEVILSGGEPLLVKDAKLEEMINHLVGIPHLHRLRIHTRMPIAIPARITDKLCDILQKTRLQTIVVLHSNHPNEINNSVDDAISKLRVKNIMLLNQSVLLRGINDEADVLIKLSKKLFTMGVFPYYLHLLDKVQGSAHFDVTESKARKIICTMQNHLPGYLVPRLVREVPGMLSKQWVGLSSNS